MEEKQIKGRQIEEKQIKEKLKRCPYAKKCGGCTQINMPYEEQAARREQKVRDCVGAFGTVEPIVRMKNPDHYRNKVTAVFAVDYKHGKKPYCGIYEKQSHTVVDVEKCLLEDLRADAICRSVLSLVPSFKIPIYDEDRGTGVLRYVQVRTARATKQVMVTIVSATPVFPAKNNFVKALLKLHPEITTIVLNVNTRTDSMILGNREIVLYGPGFIEDRLCGKTFRLSSQSFYQVNPLQTEKLYNIAIDMAGLSGKETILDAYCGIGTIGICASDRARKIIGVEVNAEAVKDAEKNAKRNYKETDSGVTSADRFSYYTGDAGKFMTEMAESGECPDVVFMDPPRAGASEEFLHALLKLRPKKIVYISCSPDTLCRDLAVLCGNADYKMAAQVVEEKLTNGEKPSDCLKPAGGDLARGAYRLKKAVPVDMFPATSHVETCVLLVRECSHDDEMVSIKVDMDGISLKQGEYKPDEKPTYGNIKKWVKEKYGFNVTSLYIGQIKDKVGIKERKNYNIGSRDGKVPNCPPEKEEAIMEAFRHFGLI